MPINLILHGAAMSRVPEAGQLPALTALAIVLGRMLFMPLCGLGIARFFSTHLQVCPSRATRCIPLNAARIPLHAARCLAYVAFAHCTRALHRCRTWWPIRSGSCF